MKTLAGRMGTWLAVIAVVVLLGAAPARAGDFTLTFWNVDEFNNASPPPSLTVHVDLVGADTHITFTYNPGGFLPTLLGLDKFGYNDPATPLTGLDGFTLAKTGGMDGFGSYDFRYDDGANLGLADFVIAGNHVGDFTSADQFAAHIRFTASGSCSGFVGGHAPDTTHSEPGCGTAVAEPAILALAGFGFVGLGLVTRRWRKK